MQIMNGKTMRAGVLLASAMMMTMTGRAQQRSADLGVTVNLEHAQAAASGSPSFWLKGGSVDVAYSFFHGFGLAAEFGGNHARANPGITVSEYVFQGGPRYSMALPNNHVRIFTEALFGVAHGFNGLYPSGSGTASTANGMHMQIGGGVNWRLQHGFGVRPIEMDYVHSTLPNNAANSQNDFRVAFGITYHLGR